MMQWIKDHKKVCNKNYETCDECYWIEESLSALLDAQEHRIEQEQKQQAQVKPRALVYNHKLKEWL
jgi:hypothetical protein